MRTPRVFYSFLFGDAVFLFALIWQQIESTVVQPPMSTLDPTTITLIGGMIITIIGTIVTGIVTVITSLRVTSVSSAQAITTANLMTVAKDTETIKGHVNSEKTAAEGREVTLRKENELLRQMLADKTSTAALLAQAAAVNPVAATMLAAAQLPAIPTSTSSVGGISDLQVQVDANKTAIAALRSPEAVDSLVRIDANTAAIEKNTAKTDATVTKNADMALKNMQDIKDIQAKK